jgi:soluble lytic murein transglycosylase-like protein/TolA-binding protein
MKKKYLFLITFFLFAISWTPVEEMDDSSFILPRMLRVVADADSAYQVKNFSLAVKYYEKLSDKSRKNLSPSSRFKFAYALHRDGQHRLSNAHFDSLSSQYPSYLPLYRGFFEIKNLWKINSFEASARSEKFIARYKNYELADSLILPLADYYYDDLEYNKARKYYRLYKKKRVSKHKRAYVSIRSALSLYYNNKPALAQDEFIQVLRKYPSAPETAEFVEWLYQEENKLFNEQFFKVVDVYYRNKKYKVLKNLLEDYIKGEDKKSLKEKARFNLIKLYFAKKQYSTALYGFKNMLAHLENKNLEPKIRLQIARIYLNKGQKQNAIDSYLDYAARFPRRRIAPEAVWKAAWISEENRNLQQAMTLYQKVRKTWPGKKLAREAYFREGFTSFRLGDVESAESVFNSIRFKRWPDIDKNRATFWVALCRDIQDDSVTARRLRLGLAKNLWDDYYTMKSYLMHKSDFDSTIGILSKFEDSAKELTYYSAGKLIHNFEDAFEVKDVLGEKYTFIALEDIKHVAQSLDEWVALAEIYKKLKAYGKSFKTYDYINRKFFADKAFVDKAFILKERFPFYYDSYVLKNARSAKIEPELILALMKQESTFDYKAHSWANAYGLMQLIPATAKEMASLKKVTLTENTQLFDPELNIRLGTQYLKQLSKRFKGKKEWVLAAYNAGPHRVKRWKKLPGSEQVDVFIENVEYSQTRDYVRKVMKNYWAYKLLQNNFQIETDTILFGLR